MLKNSKSPNRQVQRTCSWIMEAVLLLMDEKPYNKITVSDITNKAGIARQTFYRNYNDKEEVIIQYFSNIFNNDMLTVENVSGRSKGDNIVLTFNITYMVKQRTNLKKLLSAVGIESLLSDKFNEWQDFLTSQNKSKFISDERFVYRYQIYYQITGILRVIMDWFKNDMPIPVDNLVKLLNYLTVDTKTHYKNVPSIKIRIINESI